MKSTSKKLLLTLCETNSRASLVDLWRDISQLTQDQFEAALSTPAKAKKAPRKKPSVAGDDRPETRIAFQLRERVGLSDVDAATRLGAALRARSSATLPDYRHDRLEDWLLSVFEDVSDSVVMAAAKKIKK